MVCGVARVVGHVSLISDMGDVQVRDEDQVEVLIPEIGDQAREVGKVDGIDSERTVSVLVVDVEIHHVGRNSVCSEAVGDPPYLGFGGIAIARLLETKSPQRRKRRPSGEVSVPLNNLFRSGAIDQVVVERAAFGTEGISTPRLLAEVEPRAPRIVEEKSVASATADTEEERNAFV